MHCTQCNQCETVTWMATCNWLLILISMITPHNCTIRSENSKLRSLLAREELERSLLERRAWSLAKREIIFMLEVLHVFSIPDLPRDHLPAILRIICRPGSFGGHFGDHLPARDHLWACTGLKMLRHQWEKPHNRLGTNDGLGLTLAGASQWHVHQY